MTQEQWLIYLYGIYPNGGIIIVAVGILVLSIVAAIPIMTIIEDETEEVKQKIRGIYKKLYIALAIFFTVSYFIPPKNVFFSIIAAPYIKESLIKEDGKLYRLDKIIDKSLSKVEKMLDEKDKE